ncbi:dihydrofolate reductase family protein [Ulvibacterium marinum]|uniref:Dihydrofolate reductase n=1 Tax=Ulvibacterium marinum TaxID=2419782 RepID=A0A3B0C3A2_9FLAO|nr:dihydrofolate reductase family protein [Ulvibacterium marinum]RKN79670.1 dihydrofolate reductase [Ulvibacterium marinum]
MSKRKIILNLCTSLDSFIEGENGEIDWCLTDQDYSMTAFLNRIDTIFFGRKSYEQLVQEMPNAFSDKKKVVFSKTLKNIDAHSRIISGNIENEVRDLINAPGKDIWLFGGANLTTTMLNLNLVDELMISVHPLLLGKGKPLFSAIERRKKLRLTDTKTFSTGLVQLYYTVEKE